MALFADPAASAIAGIVCLCLGVALVTLEMYIPGFGAPGISGIILLIAGVYMKARTWQEAMVIIAIVLMILCGMLSISLHSASKGRLSKSKLVLHESVQRVDEKDMQLFVGREGIAKTVLRPVGIGEFDGVRLNVVSEGDFLAEGTPLKVKQVEGNRIIVVKA